MRPNLFLLTLPTLALTLAGCQAKLSSSVTVDGKPFSAESCRSGQAAGFTGVDLVGTDGSRLRLVTMPNGQAAAHIFAPGAATSTELGACGPFTVERQNSQINDIYNVKGTATLSCTSGGHSVSGTITFENCH
ncbi:MAG: hypothetical protein IPK82_42810 [Polyangiaceae bacterium]|nr:hypothetical protein [Polyangiaceae bacterium]